MCQGVTSTPCLVTGLDNADGYIFRVRASNATGPGGPSGTWSAPTVDNSPPMSAPTALPAHGSAMVSWLPLVDLNDATVAATYLVTSSPDGVTCVTVATTCEVIGLGNDTNYTFSVKATDASGGTTFSPPSIGVTPISGVPGPPVVTAVTGSKAAITIAFAPPSGASTAITGYLASCRSSDGGHVRINKPGYGKPPVTASPLIVRGLTNGAHYTGTVAAFNNQGTGISSAPSNAVVPGTTPRPPRLIGATPSGNGSVSVRFSVPILSGGFLIASLCGHVHVCEWGTHSIIISFCRRCDRRHVLDQRTHVYVLGASEQQRRNGPEFQSFQGGHRSVVRSNRGDGWPSSSRAATRIMSWTSPWPSRRSPRAAQRSRMHGRHPSGDGFLRVRQLASRRDLERVGHHCEGRVPVLNPRRSNLRLPVLGWG